MAFAEAYLQNDATDSAGNKIDGTNMRFPRKGMQTLLGPVDHLDLTPPRSRTGTAHMDERLLSDYADPTRPALKNPQESTDAFTRNGDPLAEGYSQEQYNKDMAAWRGSRGGLSMSEQRQAVERSRRLINESFNYARRPKSQ
jgi:hypothetical protein